MDEQLKKEIKKLIDDAIFDARCRAVRDVIDMVNEQLLDCNVDMTFRGSIGKTGIIVESSIGNDWQCSYRTTIESMELKETAE